MISRLNVVLAVLLVIVLVLPIMTRVDYSKPNVEFLPEMKYSPAWSAYEENPNFPDGRTLQPPVSGTIARGQMPVHFGTPEKEGETPGANLPNPYQLAIVEAAAEAAKKGNASDDESDDGEQDDGANEDPEAEAQAQLRESIVRGRGLYRVFCTCCHGSGGAGDGPVAKRGYPPPPSLLSASPRQLKDGQLFHILTHGRRNMPDFAGELSQNDRWDLSNYMRDMQAGAPVPDDPADDPNNSESKGENDDD